MKSSLGQVVVAAALMASPAFAQSAPDAMQRDLAVKTAEAFLAAMDRKDLNASRSLVGPSAAQASLPNLMRQRALAPTGGYWSRGRVVKDARSMGRGSYLVTFVTTYANATKQQRVMVQCPTTCTVSAFEEAPL